MMFKDKKTTTIVRTFELTHDDVAEALREYVLSRMSSKGFVYDNAIIYTNDACVFVAPGVTAEVVMVREER